MAPADLNMKKSPSSFTLNPIASDERKIVGRARPNSPCRHSTEAIFVMHLIFAPNGGLRNLFSTSINGSRFTQWYWQDYFIWHQADSHGRKTTTFSPYGSRASSGVREGRRDHLIPRERRGDRFEHSKKGVVFFSPPSSTQCSVVPKHSIAE
ncbi:hypothetical protein TNCV_4824561 [Trichonephila clavipes]|nr:hypothetical protein TNCV_4824561 [Trichonephila clavipes]